MRRALGSLILVLLVLAVGSSRAKASDLGPGLLRGRLPVGWTETRWTDGDPKTSAYTGKAGTVVVWHLPAPAEIRTIWFGAHYGVKLYLVDSNGNDLRVYDGQDFPRDGPVDVPPVLGVAEVQIYFPDPYARLFEIDVWGPRVPEPPASLTATQTGPGTVLLEWQPADDFAATWRIYQDGQLIAEIPSTETQYTVTGLAVGSYVFGVSGVESGGAEGARAQVTVYVADVTPPAPPGGLRAQPLQAAVRLWWQPVPDPDLDHYRVYQDGQLIGTTTDTTYTVWGLEPDTPYRFGVSAVDQAGNESEQAVVETRTKPTSPLRARVELPNLPAHLWDGLRLYGPLWLVSAGLLLGGGLVEQVLALVARLRR